MGCMRTININVIYVYVYVSSMDVVFILHFIQISV